MLNIKLSKSFKKDFKKLKKKNYFKEKTFYEIIENISKGETLHRKYKDHKLKGGFSDCRECHVQNDILLLYKIDRDLNLIYLLRIGSHSDLF